MFVGKVGVEALQWERRPRRDRLNSGNIRARAPKKK